MELGQSMKHQNVAAPRAVRTAGTRRFSNRRPFQLAGPAALWAWTTWLAVGLVSGCGGGRAPEDTVTLAIPAEVATLDPALGYDTYSVAVIHGIAAGLVDYDAGTELRPELAESWSVSDDRRRYAFTLRSGFAFANGRPVTARDFKYSLERVLAPPTKSPGAELFLDLVGARAFREGRRTDVAGVQATDDSHLVFQLEHPSPVFLEALATTFAAPVAREAVEKEGARFGDRPVAAGPFRVETWLRGQYLRLSATNNPSPALDPASSAGRPRQIRLDFTVPELTQMTRFKNQALDVTSGVPSVEIARMMADPAMKPLLVSAVVNQTWYMGMNTRQPPFDDVRVRQAVNYAVDRAKQVQLAGIGQEAYSILPPPMPGYMPAFRPYERDLERARALMRAAGHSTGARAAMWIVAEEPWRRRAQGLQADLREIGLEVELREAEFAAYLKEYKKESAQCWYGGWFPDYPDPSSFLDVLFSSRHITPTGSLNSTRYSNPRVDALLDRAARMPAGPERLGLYQEVEKQVMRDAPWAPLYFETEAHLRQPYLEGAEPHPVWRYLRLGQLSKHDRPR
jgi:ABC-type oligopeptide transport system substrate-binding subunit